MVGGAGNRDLPSYEMSCRFRFEYRQPAETKMCNDL